MSKLRPRDTVEKRVLRLLAVVSLLTLYPAAVSARPDDSKKGRRLARAEARREPSPAKRYISSQAYLHAMRAEMAALRGHDTVAAEELQLALVYDPESTFLALELAKATHALGQTGKAKKLIARVMERQPAHVDALLLSGQIAVEEQQLAEAERLYRKAASAAPDDMRAILGLAAVLERKGRPKEAARVLERGAERAPQSTEALAALAKLEKSQKNHRAAVRALERAMSRDPHDVELAVELSDALERLALHAEAAERWRLFVEAHPEEPIALLEAARSQLWLEHDGPADEYLERLESHSSSWETQRAIGMMLLSEGRNARAADILREVVREKPDDRIRNALAIALHRIGKDDEALAELELIREGEFYEAARVAVAELLMHEGKLERAEIALRNALGKRSGSAAIVGLLAQVLERKGDVEGAIVLLREAPADVATRKKLAGVEAAILSRQGRKDEARRLMSALTYDADQDSKFLLASFLWDVDDKKRALETLAKLASNPDADAVTLNFLGYAYAEEGKNLEEAEDLVERALAMEPRSPAIIDSYGWVLYRRGRMAEAERALVRAFRLSPRDPEIGEHLGDVMRARGNLKGARAVYREAMDLVRDRVRAREPGAAAHRDRLGAKVAELK